MPDPKDFFWLKQLFYHHVRTTRKGLTSVFEREQLHLRSFKVGATQVGAFKVRTPNVCPSDQGQYRHYPATVALHKATVSTHTASLHSAVTIFAIECEVTRQRTLNHQLSVLCSVPKDLGYRKEDWSDTERECARSHHSDSDLQQYQHTSGRKSATIPTNRPSASREAKKVGVNNLCAAQVSSLSDTSSMGRYLTPAVPQWYITTATSDSVPVGAVHRAPSYYHLRIQAISSNPPSHYLIQPGWFISLDALCDDGYLYQAYQ